MFSPNLLPLNFVFFFFNNCPLVSASILECCGCVYVCICGWLCVFDVVAFILGCDDECASYCPLQVFAHKEMVQLCIHSGVLFEFDY